MKRTTKFNPDRVEETVDDPRWQSPSHQTSIEVETKRGVKRKSVQGIKSPSYFGHHVRGVLTDKKIAKYIKEGFYKGERRRPLL